MERPPSKTRKQKLLYIVGCEGKNQEPLYFNRVRELINSMEERKYDVNFDFPEPYGGNPKCVVERTIQQSIGKTNKVSVFDFDGKKEKYEQAIDLAIENRIDLGNTNFCFDLWLILHKEDYFNPVFHQDDYADYVKRVYGLEKKKDIKRKEIVERIVEQISFEDIKNAIARADKIDIINRSKTAYFTPQKQIPYYDNPDTQIHKALRVIFNKAGIQL